MHDPRLVYQQGDHICTLYSSFEEQVAASVEYIKGGLARGERCLFVCRENDPDEFRAHLEKAGIDVKGEEARGALILLTRHDGHLKGGTFDASRMITMLEAAVSDALAAGFSGLCAAGDMSWVLDGAAGTEQLAEYEALLNHFYKSKRALGLCLYNRHALSPETLDHGIATHRLVRVGGPILLENPFYEEPEVAAKRRSRASRDEVEGRIEKVHCGRAREAHASGR